MSSVLQSSVELENWRTFNQARQKESTSQIEYREFQRIHSNFRLAHHLRAIILYLQTGSIRYVCKEEHIGRNTLIPLLKEAGVYE